MPVYEHELIGHFLAPVGADKVRIAKALGPDAVTNLRLALTEALIDADSANLVDHEIVEISAPTTFKSILLRGSQNGDGRRMVAFSFKDAFSDSALPLLGVLIAVFAGAASLATLPGALGVVKTLWQKTIVLREPDDADAITLLDAIGRVGAVNLLIGKEIAPSWAEISGRSGLEEQPALTALKYLRAKAVIEIADWGGAAEDVANPANRWRVRF